MKIKLSGFKLTIILSTLTIAAAVSVLAAYLWLLPMIVASHVVHQQINSLLYKYTGANFVIENPALETKLPANIAFSADKFLLVKNNENIVVADNINTKFSLTKIFLKTLKINTLGADYIYIDVNKVLSLAPKTGQQTAKSGWDIDFLDSLLYLKNLKILYNINNNIFFDVNAKNMQINHAHKRCKFVHFDINTTMKKGGRNTKLSIADDNKVYIKQHQLFIDNCILKVNKSLVNINANARKNKKYKLEVFSKNFAVENVIDLVKYDLIIPNGSELLAYFKDITGQFDFKFTFTNKGLSGDVNLDNLSLLFVPVKDVPVNLHKGHILISSKDIELKDFEGFYGTRKINHLKFSGIIKDYLKTFDTSITADAAVTNDFAKFYLSEIIGYPVGIVGKADTKLLIKSLKGVTDLTWLFKISPECDLLVGGEPIGKYRVERVLVSKMQIVKSFLHINSMDYYVTVPGLANFTKRRIVSLNGVIDFAKGVDFREIGFDITEPMPGEFLNMIIRQDFFRKGTVTGKLKAIDGDKGVKLFGNLNLSQIRIPSQRLYIENGRLSTDFNSINITSSGKYRRSNYNLSGNFFNNIAFPIIVNNIALSIDSIDIARLLQSFNSQGTNQPELPVDETDMDGAISFDLANLIIKKCTFTLGQGSYKLINFGNLHADMSLDENSVLKLNSNRFDFAEGHSSCHVNCDLKKHKYNVRLGAKDVDSDIIATSLLDLKKEISGKASGIIDLYTDKSLKLNGNIKFLVKDGTIGKIGLIEYVLKVASVFRNPLAMISPATIFDLMNIPDGKFDKIEGTLDINNNIVEHIKIKSIAPMLSAYIAGRFDLENRDASLRIYTRLSNKHKGVYGILRNISLSSIASRVSPGGRNDMNYYSSELSELPGIDANDKDCQIFLTKIDGDIENNNFISSLKKLK
ncbi:MAG: AsmA-like C-terminal region-containing protein [Candidatus Gastranaerophilales bacterium]|nr:AsmA-like C-terminal region-containing protein [Candidatus Gastranaerophilales bacterium]